MKRYIFSFIISMYIGCGLLVAQPVSSLFQPLSWEQASMLAARENKLVMVQVGNVGKEVNQRIRKDEELLNYLLRNVIAIHVDMETPQGRAFEPRLMLYSYPAYAFFMPYGDLVGIVALGEVKVHPERLLEVLDEAKELARVKKRNSRSLKFVDINLEGAKAWAAKEGKNIFINIANDTVQASLLMDKNVFTLNPIADYYNQHFINLRMDASFALELMQKYCIKEIPAYLYLNKDGKLLFHEEGICSSEVFLKYGEEALKKSQGISLQNLSDVEMLEQAKNEGKFIFIDYYVEGRVHQELVKKVFTDPEVVDFFAGHFINVARVNDNACLVFADGNGRELHRVLEVKDAADLLNEARKVISGRGLAGLSARYSQGDCSATTLEEYIVALARAGYIQAASQMTMQYLNTMDPACLEEKRYWDFFYKYGVNVEPSFFDYVLSNRDKLTGLYGKETVQNKISELWIAGAEGFVKDNQFDEEGFKLYIKRLKKEKVEGWQSIVRNARMNAAEKLGDWKTYINLAEEKWNEEKIGDSELYSWALKIKNHCMDGNIRYKMAQWLAQRVIDIDKKEKLTGKIDLTSYLGFFEQLSNDILKE